MTPIITTLLAIFIVFLIVFGLAFFSSTKLVRKAVSSGGYGWIFLWKISCHNWNSFVVVILICFVVSFVCLQYQEKWFNENPIGIVLGSLALNILATAVWSIFSRSKEYYKNAIVDSLDAVLPEGERRNYFNERKYVLLGNNSKARNHDIEVFCGNQPVPEQIDAGSSSK